MQGIEIPIGANLDQLKAAQKEIKDRLNKIKNDGESLGQGLGNGLAKGSNQAAFALQNLGRVAQDAPFGFIGIQNNLNPLLDSFQQLKQQTGSTGSALKALGQSLIGPAGIGIALSVVSSAILFYQQYQQKANKVTNDAKKSADDYANSLNQLQQAQLKGATSAQDEITKLSLLYKEYQNQNLPLEQRKEAYQDLQKLYPAYFGNIAFETTATEKTTSAYNKLTSSILANARAKAAADLITKNATRQLENEQKILDLTTELANKRAEADKARAINLASLGAAGQEGTGSITAANNEIKALKGVEQIQKQINDLKTDSNILTEKNLQLEKSAQEQRSKIDPKFNDNIDKSNKSIKTQSEILADLSTQFIVINSQIKGTFGDQNKERINALNDAIKELVKIKAPQNVIAQLQNQIVNLDQSAFERKGLTLGLNLIQGIQKGATETAIGAQIGVDITEDMAEGFNRGLPVVAKNFSSQLKTGLTDWQMYVNETLLPQLQRNFETFFNDILMRGKLSFESLGKAIVNTFLSALASDAAKELTNLFKYSQSKDSTDAKKDGTGLLKGIASLFASKGAAAAVGGKAAAVGATTAAAGGTTAALGTATVASGGALLPILAGIAAVATIASLIKKKKPQAPVPMSSQTISTSAAQSFQDFGGGRVVFEISGTNLIGVLNRAGAKLQRFGP